MLYLDSEQQWEMLSNEQAGILIKALLRYSKTGERIQTDDGMVLMAFSFIAAQIDRDGEKWQKTCERRREAGKLGGRPKKQPEDEESKEKQKNHLLFEKAKKADTETVTETDTVTVTVIDNNISAEKPQKRTRFVKPTFEQIAEYCRERGNNVDPQRFFDYYEANGWTQGKGKPIKNWQAAVRTWERNEYGSQAKSKEQQKTSSIDLDDINQLVNCF